MNQTTVIRYPGSHLDSDDSFRLVVLQNGRGDEPLVVRLVETRLSTAPTYEALSYVWGNPTTEELQILKVEEDDNNTTEMNITPNCHAALLRLRSADQPRRLWIDSICINQTLVPERNHQLSLMTRIYRAAERVVVFLGEGTEDTYAAINTLRELDRPSDYGKPDLRRRHASISSLQKEQVEALFHRPWFHRVWVLQEITVAKRAAVICGNQEMDWESVRSFYHWNNNCYWKARLMVPYSVEYPASHSQRLFRFVSVENRLLEMLQATRSCGATDARDKVYAIVPLLDWERDQVQSQSEDLADPSEQEAPQPAVQISLNYDRSVVDVYTELAISFLKSAGLGILELVYRRSLVYGLPSWVPDWSTDMVSWRSPEHPRSSNWNSEYFAGVSQKQMATLGWKRWKGFEAPVPQTWSVSEIHPSEHGVSTQLGLKVVRAGFIKSLGDICDVDNNSFPIHQWAGLAPQSGYHEPQHCEGDKHSLPSFLRVLVGDRVPNDFYASWVIDGACDISRYDRTNSQTEKQVDRTIMLWDEPDEILQELWESRIGPVTARPLGEIFTHLVPSQKVQCEHLFAQCDKKRFFVSDEGYIGLAPEQAAVNDLLFIVVGARVPFVFRAEPSSAVQPGSSVEDQDYFELVGEAYIQGLMHGEIWGDGTRDVREEDIVVR